jgi:hypothetical protein
VALQFGGNDWMQTINLQLFGYRIGTRVMGGAGYHGEGPYTFQSPQFDGCWRGIDLCGPIGHTVKVLGGDFAPYNPALEASDPNRRGAVVACEGGNVKGLVFAENYVFGRALFAVWLNGVDNVRCSLNDVRTSGSEGAAFTAINGRRIRIRQNFVSGFAMATCTNGSVDVVCDDNQ